MADTNIKAPPVPFNFAAHLIRINHDRGDKPVYIDDHGQLTYGELEEAVKRMASALLSSGMRREERILILMHDSNDWPVAFLGALYAGAVPVAVNTLLTPKDYQFILDDCRAKVVIVSAALLPTLQTAIEKSNNNVATIVVSAGEENPTDGTQPFASFLQSVEPAQQCAETHPDEPAFWLYSSGSTGQPKGTVHTHANLYWTAELYGKAILGIVENDICFSAAKLFFAYGLGNALSFPLSVGASVVLMAERPTPDAVFARWIEHQPNLFFSAPNRLCRNVGVCGFTSQGSGVAPTGSFCR